MVLTGEGVGVAVPVPVVGLMVGLCTGGGKVGLTPGFGFSTGGFTAGSLV
ncbi:MAG: hypothetical protein BWY45_01663 [Euryarchaeota archaeon ADurb.Bin294]|nr:MAG: hypothetical protein BWY45_01663 [Euryarchaeota archaeon ADurb.Bin294]